MDGSCSSLEVSNVDCIVEDAGGKADEAWEAGAGGADRARVRWRESLAGLDWHRCRLWGAAFRMLCWSVTLGRGADSGREKEKEGDDSELLPTRADPLALLVLRIDGQVALPCFGELRERDQLESHGHHPLPVTSPTLAPSLPQPGKLPALPRRPCALVQRACECPRVLAVCCSLFNVPARLPQQPRLTASCATLNGPWRRSSRYGGAAGRPVDTPRSQDIYLHLADTRRRLDCERVHEGSRRTRTAGLHKRHELSGRRSLEHKRCANEDKFRIVESIGTRAREGRHQVRRSASS